MSGLRIKDEEFYQGIIGVKNLPEHLKEEARARFAEQVEDKKLCELSDSGIGHVSTFEEDGTWVSSRSMSIEEIANHCEGDCSSCTCEKKPHDADADDDDDTFYKKAG